jgi:hypothetical protein
MAIARKPSRPAQAPVDVDALINRGGSPSGGPIEGQAKTTPILLRIPTDMMERLDTALKNRPVRLPRHTWILEAIHEKLTRELPTKG